MTTIPGIQGMVSIQKPEVNLSGNIGLPNAVASFWMFGVHIHIYRATVAQGVN
jgi:hypothetical protein